MFNNIIDIIRILGFISSILNKIDNILVSFELFQHILRIVAFVDTFHMSKLLSILESYQQVCILDGHCN